MVNVTTEVLTKEEDNNLPAQVGSGNAFWSVYCMCGESEYL